MPKPIPLPKPKVRRQDPSQESLTAKRIRIALTAGIAVVVLLPFLFSLEDQPSTPTHAELEALAASQPAASSRPSDSSAVRVEEPTGGSSAKPPKPTAEEAPPPAGAAANRAGEPPPYTDRRGTLAATPNPIKVCDGSGLGFTTISWSGGRPGWYDVSVGSGNGKLFARFPTRGAQETGKWVTHGMKFVAVDMATREEVGSVVVNLTTAGCR